MPAYPHHYTGAAVAAAEDSPAKPVAASRFGPAMRSMGKVASFCLCFCLSLFLFGSAGCARQSADEKDEGEFLRQLDPSDWNISPEATLLYYYLLLAQGMSDNSRPVISFALQGLIRLDPSLPIYRDSATILLARGEYSAAESVAGEGLKLYPEDPILTLLLAGTYSENGQAPKAVAFLEDYLQSRPEVAEVTEELVRLYLKEGQDKKASDLLARLPRTGQSPESELFRAGVLAAVGRNTEARELLQRLLSSQPTLFEAWLELAYIADREKKLDEAVEAYGKAAELMPDNAEIWFRIAVLQIAKGDPSEALRTLEKASPSASLYMQGASRFADAGYYKEAEILLEKSRETGGGPDELALILSMIRQESAEDPKEGLAPLEGIAPESPLYPTALQQKVRIHLQAGEYDEAHSVAVDARRRFPDRKELWGLEAYALVKMKKTGEAEDVLQRSLERYPGDEDLLFSLGSIQDETGKKDEAMKTMELIITINPKNGQALNYVGYTLAENNRELGRALTLITAALEQNPDAEYIVDSLAWAQYRLGRFEDAWKNINRSISLGGDAAAIWEHYGDIALALGKREEAAKGYAEAIARRPDNIDALRAKLTELSK